MKWGWESKIESGEMVELKLESSLMTLESKSQSESKETCEIRIKIFLIMVGIVLSLVGVSELGKQSVKLRIQ